MQEQKYVAPPGVRDAGVKHDVVISPPELTGGPEDISAAHQRPKAAVNTSRGPSIDEHGQPDRDGHHEISDVDNGGEHRSARKRKPCSGESKRVDAGQPKPSILPGQPHPPSFYGGNGEFLRAFEEGKLFF